MDVIELLEEAIEMWKDLVKQPDSYFKNYNHACPLCEEFACEGCPISEDTGLEGCSGTSYYNTRACLGIKGYAVADQNMLDYLIELRDKL